MNFYFFKKTPKSRKIKEYSQVFNRRRRCRPNYPGYLDQDGQFSRVTQPGKKLTLAVVVVTLVSNWTWTDVRHSTRECYHLHCKNREHVRKSKPIRERHIDGHYNHEEYAQLQHPKLSHDGLHLNKNVI
jgi:hypothetical protein